VTHTPLPVSFPASSCQALRQRPPHGSLLLIHHHPRVNPSSGLTPYRIDYYPRKPSSQLTYPRPFVSLTASSCQPLYEGLPPGSHIVSHSLLPSQTFPSTRVNLTRFSVSFAASSGQALRQRPPRGSLLSIHHHPRPARRLPRSRRVQVLPPRRFHKPCSAHCRHQLVQHAGIFPVRLSTWPTTLYIYEYIWIYSYICIAIYV